MALFEQINSDLITSMKAGDKDRSTTLRSLKSALKYRQIEKGDDLTDDDVVAVVSSVVKKHKDSIEQFEKAGRQDLVENEQAEMAVVGTYLPAQMAEDDLIQVAKEVISESGASSPKDFGIVMKGIMPKVKGKADGKLVKDIVTKLLST